jgi:hypothetical protein
VKTPASLLFTLEARGLVLAEGTTNLKQSPSFNSDVTSIFVSSLPSMYLICYLFSSSAVRKSPILWFDLLFIAFALFFHMLMSDSNSPLLISSFWYNFLEEYGCFGGR